MRNMSAFLGIGMQLAAEKKEASRLTLEAQAKAENDPHACRVHVKEGAHAGQSGVLQTWASTDGLVAVLLSDGRVVKVTASAVEKHEAQPVAAFDSLDAEHKQVALENGFVAAVHTPTSDEESRDIIAKFIRSNDTGRRALGEQMLANRAALTAASRPTADFSRLAVYAAVKLRVLGPDQTEVIVGNKTIFFSHETPVAAIEGDSIVKTNAPGSPTATRHLEAWLAGRTAEAVDQSYLDQIGSQVEAAAKTAVVNVRAFDEVDDYRAQEDSAMGEVINANMAAIMSEWSATTLADLNRSVYKNTGAGARVSFELDDGSLVHNGDERLHDKALVNHVAALQVGTIIEGSDATVESDWIDLADEKFSTPASAVSAFQEAVDYVDSEASMLFEANLKSAKTVKADRMPGYEKDSRALERLEEIKRETGETPTFKVEDIGVQAPDYFEGRGVSGTEWDAVFVGIGNSYNAALEDAMELAAVSGYNVENVAKTAKSTDPRADVDAVQVYRDSMAPGESEVADDGSVDLHYHVALYIKGDPSLEASQRILVKSAPAKPMSEKTREVIKRALAEKAAAEQAKSAPKLAPPPDLKKKAEELAKPAAPEAPKVPPYKGIQKPEFQKAKTGEEAHKLKHEKPGAVKEADAAGPLTVQEDKPGQVDETKLGKLQDAPEELKELVSSSLKRKETVAAIKARMAQASKDVADAEGYEDESKKASEEDAAIAEMLEAYDEEAVRMDNAILALIRGGLKPKYAFTEEQTAKLKEMTKAQEDFVKECNALAEKEGRVSYTEDRAPRLFTDPSKRKGEGATGLPGADTKKKAGIKSELAAGIAETLKKALTKLKDLAKSLFSDMDPVTDILEEAAAAPADADDLGEDDKSEKKDKAEPKEKSEKKDDKKDEE